MPKECKIQKSNNNVDIVHFHGKYYLAFRTAPSHFPSKKAVLYLLSSKDLQTWTLENTLAYRKDIREPRFFQNKDTLFLMFFLLKGKMTTFEPENVYVTFKTTQTSWSDTFNVQLPGYVPWRVRYHQGRYWLSVYDGKNLYNKNHKPDLRLLYSYDGFQWKPISEKPQIQELSAEEGEFIFDKQGNLFSVVRAEGFGSFNCFANADSLHLWQKKYSPFKYDSSLLFEHQEFIFLIARRNLDGPADKLPNRTTDNLKKRRKNLIRYSLTPKKTAIFWYNTDSLTLQWLQDFPSHGDNAFPAICPIPDNPNAYFLVNYSSDLKKERKNWCWLKGQLKKTYLYATILTFQPL